MKIKAICFFVILCFLKFTHSSWALKVISPESGTEVIAGSAITVVVKPGVGEEWEVVSLGFDPMTYDSDNNEYHGTLIVPSTLIGSIDDLIIYGKDKNGNSTWLSINVFVKMPQNIFLEEIAADPDSIILYKLSPNSDLNDIRIFENKNLSIGGIFSDGIERELTASTTGTIYSSSNNEVVTVSIDGKVTAQGVGAANIIIKNGKLIETVEVIVKPFTPLSER